MKTYLAGFICLVSLALQAQVFEYTYGSLSDDNAQKVIRCLDGNYVLAGLNGSSGGAYFVCIDTAGHTLWQKTYGPPTGLSYNDATCCMQTHDSGFIVVTNIGYGNGNV